MTVVKSKTDLVTEAAGILNAARWGMRRRLSPGETQRFDRLVSLAEARGHADAAAFTAPRPRRFRRPRTAGYVAELMT